MTDLQPVCDKCGQQVDMDHFEQRIDQMKVRLFEEIMDVMDPSEVWAK